MGEIAQRADVMLCREDNYAIVILKRVSCGAFVGEYEVSEDGACLYIKLRLCSHHYHILLITLDRNKATLVIEQETAAYFIELGSRKREFLQGFYSSFGGRIVGSNAEDCGGPLFVH